MRTHFNNKILNIFFYSNEEIFELKKNGGFQKNYHQDIKLVGKTIKILIATSVFSLCFTLVLLTQ